jgi:hypothetical protein
LLLKLLLKLEVMGIDSFPVQCRKYFSIAPIAPITAYLTRNPRVFLDREDHRDPSQSRDNRILQENYTDFHEIT